MYSLIHIFLEISYRKHQHTENILEYDERTDSNVDRARTLANSLNPTFFVQVLQTINHCKVYTSAI